MGGRRAAREVSRVASGHHERVRQANWYLLAWKPARDHLQRRQLHGGNTIKLDPNATTTLTGTLDDTNAVARRGERLPGATQMGDNVGGINILRSPKWGEIQVKYKPLLDAGDTTAYWKAVTDEFLGRREQAVAR